MNYEDFLLPPSTLNIILNQFDSFEQYTEDLEIDKLEIDIHKYVVIDKEYEEYFSCDEYNFNQEINNSNKHQKEKIELAQEKIGELISKNLNTFKEILEDYFSEFRNKVYLHQTLFENKIYEEKFPFIDWLYELKHIYKLNCDDFNQIINTKKYGFLEDNPNSLDVYDQFFNFEGKKQRLKNLFKYIK
jgi:hypothetical protein